MKRAAEAIKYGAMWSTVGWGLWAMLALVFLGVAITDVARYAQMLACFACVPGIIFLAGLIEFLYRTSARRATTTLEQQGITVELRKDDPN